MTLTCIKSNPNLHVLFRIPMLQELQQAVLYAKHEQTATLTHNSDLNVSMMVVYILLKCLEKIKIVEMDIIVDVKKIMVS